MSCIFLEKLFVNNLGDETRISISDLNKNTDFSDDDKGRRNTIINLLKEWQLIEIVNPKIIEEPRSPMGQIKIISYADKKNWILEAKYNIGKKNRNS